MTLVVIIIILALVFDYINGFHDAANSIATIVSTKVLTPFQAVLWAAMFNFGAFFLFKDHAVANTISKTVFEVYISLEVILAGLLAAIFWNLLTWWLGIPSSSSHTLIGGFAGAAIMHGFMLKGVTPIGEIVASDSIMKTIWFIFLAPIIGMVISAYITLVTLKRNYWGKLSLIVLSSIAMFFMFDYFMDVKMEENLNKFYKVSQYKKSLEKNPNDVVLKQKYAAAQRQYDKALLYLPEYTKIGKKETVSKILAVSNVVDLEVEKQKEIVEKILGLEIIKKEAFLHPQEQQKLIAATALVASCYEDFKEFHNLGKKQTVLNVSKKLGLGKVQEKKLQKLYSVNIQKSLAKELDNADNRMLNYSMMLFFAIFAITYYYVEKIRKPTAAKMQNMFKKLQLLSSAAFSLGHGGSDAQKVMGIIGAALIANGTIVDFKEIPNWVPLACYTAIALGTLSGGWKIVKTMGSKITKVTPLEGVGAETAGAITLFMTAQMGIPVSTTHTITGSIIGVGATKRLSAVRWGVTRSLMIAWIITIPISAILAALIYAIIALF